MSTSTRKQGSAFFFESHFMVYCRPHGITHITHYTHLRSAQQNTLVVPRYRLTTYGRRAFSVAGPTAWNSLPVAFRDRTISDACFRRHLKTVLFAQQRQHHSV